jgi:hypothetical protein
MLIHKKIGPYGEHEPNADEMVAMFADMERYLGL